MESPMPMYEFKCDGCEREVEQLFSTWSHMNAATKAGVICDKCGGKMRRIVSAPPSFNVTGFNAENGYHREPKRTRDIGGFKVTTEER